MTAAETDASHSNALSTVEAFVLRARRVCSHSLAADPEALAEMTKPKVEITVDEASGTATITRRLPPEEVVESLAARVRPLILQRDPVHYGKVLRALGRLLHGQAEAAQALKYVAWLRGQWSNINSESDETRAYRVEVGRIDQSVEPSVASDNTLAFAWFYGDVVHADADRRRVTSAFSVVDRFEAAVFVVARVAWLTHATLNFIEQLRQADLLPVADWAFEEDVVVGVTEVTQKANVLVAPEGTPPPASLYEAFSDDWKPLAGTRRHLAEEVEDTAPEH